jgi:hypothetical protein
MKEDIILQESKSLTSKWSKENADTKDKPTSYQKMRQQCNKGIMKKASESANLFEIQAAT